MRLHLLIPAAAALLAVPSATLCAQTTVVFEGEPLRKVESSFEETRGQRLGTEAAFKAQLRIVERSGHYYWQTRGMKELSRSTSGAYVTYTALDGSGYIRVHIPMMLDLRERLTKDQREREIGYTEHLLIQFASVTYFGNRLSISK